MLLDCLNVSHLDNWYITKISSNFGMNHQHIWIQKFTSKLFFANIYFIAEHRILITFSFKVGLLNSIIKSWITRKLSFRLDCVSCLWLLSIPLYCLQVLVPVHGIWVTETPIRPLPIRASSWAAVLWGPTRVYPSFHTLSLVYLRATKTQTSQTIAHKHTYSFQFMTHICVWTMRIPETNPQLACSMASYFLINEWGLVYSCLSEKYSSQVLYSRKYCAIPYQSVFEVFKSNHI